MTAGGGKRAFLLALCAVATLVFTALGLWQLERRAWKLDLIARVDARVGAAPMALPPRPQWSALATAAGEYRRVRLAGTFAHDKETLVDALTRLGSGYWVVTPLRTEEGAVLINRGFVPREQRAPSSRVAGQVQGLVVVTGLLRLSEPDGRFLRPNEPSADRWFSRDVAAIARARGVANPAPFFVDADAAPIPGGSPVGGLTVVAFRNTHLIYALTWFGLGLLSATGLVLLINAAHHRR